MMLIIFRSLYEKKLLPLIMLILCCFCYGQTIEPTENEKIQFAMLLNQIQYTASNIIQNRNKEILNQEFDFIINQIDKSKLYDQTIKNSYIDLLETIKKLKLTENERNFIIEINEREKKQAYTKAFSSFGSVFSSGFSPASLITSLAYAGVSAGLNIMSADYEADNKLKEQMFRLDQKDLDEIDESRISLFSSYTDVFTEYKIPTTYEITEDNMKDFIKQIANNKDNYKNLITILEK